ncbi:ferric uptake regulator, Fur family [Solidesulfovibrio carbinoliphilus subsp. oakridgensis]|uniref:Ferric uptake regulator, Fur family n=1 Tax=Solidesulfovibrio carbinoliphilus subsp. oakridgensis TaxID=694327 RepID=G7Q8R9_9BACT|nr:transcriptional repressor [Solidesulfovibrio carbinoliphilus]EHJ49156.1 ferric uptake regulator, Fur family [Solidesulfovibrio carbinoliphilus subsp. oakridgensis]
MDAPTDRLAAMVARLRERGHRISPQRLAILGHLVESPDHPTAETLYRRLLPRFPDLSLATVYKTIAALKACGEILELQFSGQDNRYDAACPTPHPHCICLACGAIADPPAPGVQAMAKALAEATGYAITSHRLDFYGLCPACRRKREQRQERE